MPTFLSTIFMQLLRSCSVHRVANRCRRFLPVLSTPILGSASWSRSIKNWSMFPCDESGNCIQALPVCRCAPTVVAHHAFHSQQTKLSSCKNVPLTFESVNKILQCDKISERNWTALSSGAFHDAVQCGSNCSFTGWRFNVQPFKWAVQCFPSVMTFIVLNNAILSYTLKSLTVTNQMNAIEQLTFPLCRSLCYIKLF